MRKILTLVLLLSFACSEETEFQCEYCINMTISDALPIQFWKNDCPTYNEKESCGVHSFCWTQKFHCDDEIRLQFEDEEDDLFNERFLTIIDENENVVSVMPFSQTSLDTSPNRFLYNIVFTPSLISPDLCNSKFRFEISKAAIQLYDSNFDIVSQAFNPRTGLGNYWGISPNGIGWTQTTDKSFMGFTLPNGCWFYNPSLGDGISVNLGQSYQFSEVLSQNFEPITTSELKLNVVTEGNYTFAYNAPCTVNIKYDLLSNGVVISTYNRVINSDGSSPDIGNLSEVINFGSVIAADEIQVSLSKTGSTTVFSFTNVNYIEMSFDYDGDPIPLAKSDFVEFSDNLSCTQLVKYRNQRNFAGIDYANLPDDAYFYKRIPAVFFHEQFPGEDEQAELSDSKIIALNGVLRAQKLLDTDYMPYHEHKKNQLILKHQFVEIDGDRWTKQDAYEIAEGNKRYPLKKATCWLTNRDFVARNVI